MKTLAAMLDELGYRALVGVALVAAIAISGAGALLVGGIWITWRFWDFVGAPTALVFRSTVWAMYWPALVGPAGLRKDELSIAVISFVAWFGLIGILLAVGRGIRTLQGRTYSS